MIGLMRDLDVDIISKSLNSKKIKRNMNGLMKIQKLNNKEMMLLT
jgi:hypothetical protein